MPPAVLKVDHLTKQYDQYLAVDHISFELQKGEILGLLGPNGAGKSTTIQMLLGLTSQDAGTIEYFGHDFNRDREKVLARINFSSAYTELQARMTVYQNLRIYAGFYQVPEPEKKIMRLLEQFEIAHLRNDLFWHLSAGQKTRVILAKALLNDPEILLLDEPTASLDPDIVNKIIELIRNLQQQDGVSMLFTSHNMEEVTRLCDRVIFLDRGKIVASDTPLNLTKMVGDAQLIITFDGKVSEVEKLAKDRGVTLNKMKSHVVGLRMPEDAIPGVLFELSERKIWITNIHIEKPNLEDVFLHIAQGNHA